MGTPGFTMAIFMNSDPRSIDMTAKPSEKGAKKHLNHRLEVFNNSNLLLLTS